jgi:hypothetical protein
MAPRLPGTPKTPAPEGEGQPTIPFEFDPPGNDFEADHLITQEVDGGARITWPLIGKSFFLPRRADRPVTTSFLVDLATIEQHNPHLKIHRLGGFSLGDYHEFFVHGVPAHRAYKFTNVEASFGEGSPLLARMFWDVYYEKYWGEWTSNTSLRIINCSLEAVERYVIAAVLEYEKEIGFLPGIQQIDLGQLEFGDDLDTEVQGRGVVRAPPVVTDLEPLRFYMAGMYSDDEAACLSFYRVLEYYAFMQQAAQVTVLRRDGTVSDAEFTRRTLEIASRDEKGPIFKLLAEITTPDILQAAVSGGVVKEARQALLNEAVYAYRNSIVHGKFGSAFTLRSQSILTPDAEAGVWRSLLQNLAWAALQNIGTKA